MHGNAKSARRLLGPASKGLSHPAGGARPSPRHPNPRSNDYRAGGPAVRLKVASFTVA